MVFEHAIIPLTVSLREERDSNSTNQSEQFLKLLGLIHGCLTKNHVPDNIRNELSEAWDYKYMNLWEARFKGQKFLELGLPQKVQVLTSRTYWYPRLKPNLKLMVKRLLSDRKGTLVLKEILHCVDGTMSSLIVTFPEALFDGPDPKAAYRRSDRIINNIIANCLFDYAGYQKDWKAFKKDLRKSGFLKEEFHPSERSIRKMSWVMDVLNVYNPMAKDNSKAKMFRVCAFTQTRATGLANKKMVATTIDEFVSEVTTIKEFHPDKYLIESIDEVCERVALNAAGPSPHFRVSMSTSSCTESRKRTEGKFGHLKQRFRSGEIPALPKFSADNAGGQIGNLVFNEALQKVRSSSVDIWKTNVAGIRENGKCRVVTSGSFYKDALLQPFSHMTIEAIKSEPLLRDSLQAGRLGYKFMSRIDHRDHIRGEILFEEEVKVASFDWTKSTDRPSHKSAHLTMGTLLKKMNAPKDIIDTVLCIWPGKKDIYINGKYKGVMVNGIPMGDPLTKTNLSLAHPICALYADKVVGKVKGVGAGNGDDGVEIKAGPDAQKWIDAFLTASKQLGYDLSEKDYFVTSDWFTYCEEVAMIPIDRFHTVPNAERLKDNRLLPYLDLPKFRLVIDTKKDRKDFASDTKGKYTLFGKDMEYVRKGGSEQENFLFGVASASQDVCLGLSYQKIPVYLPRQIFGIGKVPTNWNAVSWANAVMSQKSHPRNVTYTVMREMVGERAPCLTKLRGVLSGTGHFDKESFVEIKSIPADDPIKKFVCVPAGDWKKFPAGIIERLKGNGKLVPESKIQAYYLFQERVQELNQDLPVDLFETIRSMSIELDVPNKEHLIRVATKMKEKFSLSPWMMSAGKEEDLYPIDVIRVLEESNPLRVDLPEWEYLKRFHKKPANDGPMERAIAELETWFYDNYELVLAGEEFPLPPVQVIEDDEVMILGAERSAADIIIFVTNDRKLVNLANNKLPGKHIWNVTVETWVSQDAYEEPFVQAIREHYPGVDVEFIVDQGAFDTFLMKTDITVTRYPGWCEGLQRSKIRSQADIYDVYVPPRPLNGTNVFVGIVNIPKNALVRRGTLPRAKGT